MALRDLVVLGIVFGTLPIAFRRPFVGVLVFSWLAYMRAQDLTWGVARGMRLSFYVGAATFAGFFLFEWGRRPLWRPDLRMRLLVAVVALTGLSILFAENQGRHVFYKYEEFVKMAAIALLTSSLVDSKKRLRTMMWTIALSLGFFGIKGGVFAALGGGEILRGPGGLIQDNNDFSLAMVMNFPLLLYLGLSEEDRRLRWIGLGGAALTVPTIVLTHSRGGFLALAACSATIVWRSRRRVPGLALGALAAVAFLLAMPASYRERLASIAEYERDPAARGRLHAWGVAWDMIKDKPLTGVGFLNFQTAFHRYEPAYASTAWGPQLGQVAHNSYLQIWAEAGTPAFLVYLGGFVATLALLRRLRREADRRHFAGWIGLYARAFEASFVGFLVGAVFLNRAHFDLAHHLIGTAVAFGAVARAELASASAYPAKAAALRWVSPSGFARRAAPVPAP